jgi:hypothetical protein
MIKANEEASVADKIFGELAEYPEGSLLNPGMTSREVACIVKTWPVSQERHLMEPNPLC